MVFQISDHHGLLAPEESFSSNALQKTFFRHLWLPLQIAFEINFDISKVKGQYDLQNATDIINLYRSIIYLNLNSWTVFPYNNRQPSTLAKIDG